MEQATAASASLEEQANALTRAVGSFKLAETGQAAVRPAPAAARAVATQQSASTRSALPKREAKPPVAELPRKQAAGKAKSEDWEEF